MTRKRLSTYIQYVTPQHLLSWFAGWLSTRRWAWFKNWQFRYFINRYNVDMSAAANPNLADYPDFNSLFTRRLKPEARPIVTNPNAIACPADGCVSQIGHIDADRLLQAKGFDFSLKDLLGGSAELAALFQDGEFATIYLSPKDYHRVHMPFSGTLRETVFIPGRLFSVSQQTALDVPRLFARNERLVCLFETAIGPMAVILVGAMLVGSIRTAWGSPLPSRHIKREIYPASGAGMLKLARGEELGYFQMGSTVITLFPKGKIAWAPTLAEMSPTLVGQNMASLIPS